MPISKEEFERLPEPGVGIHNWVICEVSNFLEKEGWKIGERHFGAEPGPDILARSPNGRLYIFESEVEHASSIESSREKLEMIRKYKVEKVIFIGQRKHEQMFKKVCKEKGVSFKTQTIPLEKFIKIDEDKLRETIMKLTERSG